MDLLMIILLGIGVGGIIFMFMAFAQIEAKDKAKKIINHGTINNRGELKRVLNVLSKMTNDIEAMELWRQLHELEQSFGTKTVPMGLEKPEIFRANN